MNNLRLVLIIILMFSQDEKETLIDIGRNIDHHCYIKFIIG